MPNPPERAEFLTRPLQLGGLLFTFLLPTTGLRAEPLLLCGGGEVFLIESNAAATGPVEKLWSWRAKDHEELPEKLRRAFGTTDDCKPIEGGQKVLVSSSSGGCALVEKASGRVLWFAQVPNAHSLELLPHDRVIVASSTGQTGNRLVLFDLAHADQSIWDTPLPAAHGVIWDPQRRRLWALGETELRCYALQDWETEKPSLAMESTYPLPDHEGHDLQAVPHNDDLVLSAHRGVHLFDREKHTFRPHPDLAQATDVKSLSIHPITGRTMYVKANGPNWWSDTLRFLAPQGEIPLPNEHLYKARWLALPY